MDPSRRARREQARWQREALRRLEELDRVDREQGLGAMPFGTPVGSGSGRHRGRRTKNGRRATGPVLPGLLISALLAAFVLLQDPSMTGYRFRQIVDHLRGVEEAGSYAFVLTTASGVPVGWNSCASVPYVVNPEGAPTDWERVVTGAVDRVSEASGFEFDYRGPSRERSSSRTEIDPDDPPPVLITWADATEVPALLGSTAGIGGSTPHRADGRVRFVTGMVVLDTEAFDRMDVRGDSTSSELILAHELGHVLGLDHVEDADELMNAEYRGQDGFGPGDREGLRRLHELPC